MVRPSQPKRAGNCDFTVKSTKMPPTRSAGTWVEMTGFKTEAERLKCLTLFKQGYSHEFRKSLLRSSSGKLWFLVRTTTFTGRIRTAREIKDCTADVNRKGSDNLCGQLLRMLRADMRKKTSPDL